MMNRRTLQKAFLIVLTAALFFGWSAQAATKYATLEFGSRGSAVLKLQKALLALGFDPSGTDGKFGRGTENAVIARIAAALTLVGQSHPKVEVRAWPDRPRDYRMTHPKGAALVIYRGSKYAHHATAGQLVSYEDEFELGLISRTVREANTPDATDAAEGLLHPAGRSVHPLRLALAGRASGRADFRKSGRCRRRARRHGRDRAGQGRRRG